MPCSLQAPSIRFWVRTGYGVCKSEIKHYGPWLAFVNKVILEHGPFVSKLRDEALRTIALHGTLPIKPHLVVGTIGSEQLLCPYRRGLDKWGCELYGCSQP